MTAPRDPLTDTDRLLVDGNNLLHALARRGRQPPQAALIGRLRAVIPASIGIELVFDGAPEAGLRGERIAAGLIVRHAGRRTADEVLLGLVDQARGVGPFASSHLLVVTDDQDLRAEIQSKGARTAGTGWLLGRLERPRLAAPSIGNRRPPLRSTPHNDERDDEPERTPWKPGRGATSKRGNPRRRRPSSGSMPG